MNSAKTTNKTAQEWKLKRKTIQFEFSQFNELNHQPATD